MSDNEKKITGSQAVIRVTRTVSGKETQTDERIEIRPFATDTATVMVKGGATVNMGNYESARVDISIALPCYVEEVEEAFEFCKEYVDSKMKKEYEELREASANG